MQWQWNQQFFSCDLRLLHGGTGDEGIRASSCYQQSMVLDQCQVQHVAGKLVFVKLNSKFITDVSKTVLVSIMDSGALNQEFSIS
jgi:hypothetical protein